MASALLLSALAGAVAASDQRVAAVDEREFENASGASVLATGQAGQIGEQLAPGEFFMLDDAEDATPGDARPPAPLGPAEIDSIPPAPTASSGPPAPATEFFMRDEASWTTEPLYEADTVRGPASNAVVPGRFFDGNTDWNSVPPSDMPGDSEGFLAFLDDACCAWEKRWVNWRCCGDDLERCVPEGFYALPIIRVAWPAVMYNGPLNPGAPVEPGGSSESLARKAGLMPKPITELTTKIAVATAGEMPDEGLPSLAEVPVERVHVPGTQRAWQGMSYYWDASHLIHQPLYFEDVNLERYGYSFGCAQPFVSAARFFGRIPLLPYAMTVHPHYKADYALGYARPGSPTPMVHLRPPLSAHGAVVEAAVITGLFFAIP